MKNSVVILFASICLVATASTARAVEFVRAPLVFDASKVLPADTLAGPNYRINDKVYNDGMLNLFTITTDYGVMNAESETVLKVRLAELNALRVMEEMEKKKVFGDALVAGAKAPFKGAAALITSPIETGKGIVEGTGQFFSNLGQALVSDDPNQDNALKVAIGYDVAKRNFAYEFDINPYTTNEPVAERLGTIAQAAVAGGITTKVAMSAVDSKMMLGARIVGTAQAMKQLVRDNSPVKLREINAEKLQEMGVSANLAEAFLDNHVFDPYEETLLVGELEAMQGVKGRELFIARAGRARTSREAMLLRHQAQMLAGYHANVAKVASIVSFAGIISLRKADNSTAVVLPADRMFLTERLSGKITVFEQQAGSVAVKELVISGQLDQTVRDLLTTKGWKVTEQAEKVLFKQQ